MYVFSEIVDSVLEDEDIDNNGYLSYPEYVLARKREEAEARRQQQQGGRH